MVRDKEPLFVLSIKFHELYYLVDEKDRWWSYDMVEKYEAITVDHLKDRNTIPVYRLLSFESTGVDELIY